MPLLMIPGPIEISPRVAAACAQPPRSHLAPAILEDFGASLERMRAVWKAAPDSQPFIVPGSGSIAMEMAAHNVVDPGDAAVVAWSGYFSDRIATMLERRGVRVHVVAAEPGATPAPEAVAEALARHGAKALFVTHVDTSTGVRADA